MKLELVAFVLALAAAPAAALAEDIGRSNPVPGEKLDSGLGSLAHYSRWAQDGVLRPAGTTAPHANTPVSGEKLDSGLGELPHYRDWTDPSGRAVTADAAPRAQFANARH